MNAPFLRPAGCPAGVNPAEWREAVSARIDEMQDAMLALIAALDAMEVDPELEPSIAGGGPVSDDRERDLDLDESDEGERLEGDDYCDDEDGDLAEDNGDAEHPIGWGFGVEFVQGQGSLADCTDRETGQGCGQLSARHKGLPALRRKYNNDFRGSPASDADSAVVRTGGAPGR